MALRALTTFGARDTKQGSVQHRGAGGGDIYGQFQRKRPAQPEELDEPPEHRGVYSHPSLTPS